MNRPEASTEAAAPRVNAADRSQVDPNPKQQVVGNVAAMRAEGLVDMAAVGQDGMRVRASAGSKSFKKKETLEQLLQEAEAQWDRLQEEPSRQSPAEASAGDLVHNLFRMVALRADDRVVFLRMAEDRGLEPCDQLLKLCERADVYPRFMRDLCRRADEKYNSGLFHFQKESDVSEDPDRITPKLAVDDKVFKPILQSLYFAHGSPYHFGVLPVEILGTVYERFLGKVVRLTAGHQAKVEEKPEVRKAGGVYYTPAYIVDYIVKHTVGRQIQGRSPMQLVGLRNGKEPFRVLDMACGSGSFLLGAPHSPVPTTGKDAREARRGSRCFCRPSNKRR